MQILETIQTNKLIADGDVVAVATSGGSDSMCLLSFLKKMEQELKITVKCINIEHGIRGANSIHDSKFVCEYCESNNIPCKVESVDVFDYMKTHGGTIEEVARILRYNIFKKMVETGYCNLVAIAHNKQDNVETVLMNIFRGTSISGLKGISHKVDNYIIRPLLDTNKADILQYLSDNNIKYVEDETNSDTNFSRNFLRHDIIQQVEKVWNGAGDSILRLSSLATEDDNFLNEHAEKYVTKSKLYYKISSDCFNKKPLFFRAIKYVLVALHAQQNFSNKNFEELYKFVLTAKNSSRIELPNKIVGIKDYSYLTIVHSLCEDNTTCDIAIPYKKTEFNFSSWMVLRQNATAIEKNNSALYFDDAKIPTNAIWRVAREGDVFKPFSKNTEKSVFDFLSKKKVSTLVRKTAPCLCSNNSVLIACGIEISEDIKIDSNCQNSKMQKIEFLELK